MEEEEQEEEGVTGKGGSLSNVARSHDAHLHACGYYFEPVVSKNPLTRT